MNEAKPKIGSEDAACRTPNQPFTVLLIEDEQADGHLIKWAMAENLIQVNFHQVFDGYEALAYLRRNASHPADSPHPDLILLDLNMPRMSGLECLTAIKQDAALSDIPVVVLTTSKAESDKAASLDLGAADFFSKPMDIQELKTTIRILADRWITPHAVEAVQLGGK